MFAKAVQGMRRDAVKGRETELKKITKAARTRRRGPHVTGTRRLISLSHTLEDS